MVNLSDHKLSATEEAVAKGSKYAMTPKTNPIDIAAPMEAAGSRQEASAGKNLPGRPESLETSERHYSGRVEGISRADEEW